MDHNCRRTLPRSGNITLGHTVLVDERQDFTGRVNGFQVSVLDSVWARRGVGIGSDFCADLISCRGLEKALIGGAGGHVVDQRAFQAIYVAGLTRKHLAVEGVSVLDGSGWRTFRAARFFE